MKHNFKGLLNGALNAVGMLTLVVAVGLIADAHWALGVLGLVATAGIFAYTENGEGETV